MAIPSLHIYLGPMFSGKSTKLIDTYKIFCDAMQNNSDDDITNANLVHNKIAYENQPLSLLVINHTFDNRYGCNEIATHDLCKIPCISLNILKDIFNYVDINNITHIFIDEAQFFKDLYPVVIELLTKYKKIIYLAGLDGDYKQEPFAESNLLGLIPYATTVCKLTAKCYKCDNLAQFTKRLTTSNEKILVGGSNDYQPVCIEHM
jgi:thymidine kinase